MDRPARERSRIIQAERTCAMNRFPKAGIPVLVLVFGLAGKANADTLEVLFDPGVLNETTELSGSGTTGGMMGGMEMTLWFTDGTSETLLWQKISNSAGAAYGNGWEITQSLDTGAHPFRFLNYSGLGITRLLIDAAPGNTVFDTEWEFDTPGSGSGGDFYIQPYYLQGLDVVATYRDEVALVDQEPMGDIFRFLDVQFTNPGGFPDGKLIYFYADTDNIEYAGDIDPVPEPNLPPQAVAGEDQVVDQEGTEGTEVILDGSGSTDPDSTPGTNDDIVAFDWFNEVEVLGRGQVLGLRLEPGKHKITLVVTDSAGETASDDLMVTVVEADTTPPVVSCSVERDSLWPPDRHEMVDVGFTFEVKDNADPQPELTVTVTSDEPTMIQMEEMKWAPDASVTWNDDGTLTVLLRAECYPQGDGRVYQITLKAVDASGNIGSASCTVGVDYPRNDGNGEKECNKCKKCKKCKHSKKHNSKNCKKCKKCKKCKDSKKHKHHKNDNCKYCERGKEGDDRGEAVDSGQNYNALELPAT